MAKDPERARELMTRAKDASEEALRDLRAVVRSIYPPILADRGLEAALGALVARSPLSVSLHVDVPERLPPAVETAAYFTVAEALANATKHAGAQHVDIRIGRTDAALVAEIVSSGPLWLPAFERYEALGLLPEGVVARARR